MVAPADDPIWRTWRPPNGYQCRCRVIALSDRQAGRYIDADARRIAGDGDLAELRRTALANGPDPGWDYSICGDHPPAREGQPSPMTVEAQAGKAPAAMRGIEQAIERKKRAPYPWVSALAATILAEALDLLIQREGR
jgi:hypothetical protein